MGSPCCDFLGVGAVSAKDLGRTPSGPGSHASHGAADASPPSVSIPCAWQPIETAPRDGTWFVIMRADEPDSYEAGCFDPHYWDEYVPAGGGLYRKERKQVGDWRGFSNFHRATHWAPLPEPPAP